MSPLHIVIAGVIATAVLDVWQQIFRHAFGVPITNWAMIGRWVGHFPQGRFVYENIGKAPPVEGERALGWVVHYVVGVGYAFVYFLMMRFAFGVAPSLLSALIFGAVSVSVTWFVMEPILGAGVLGANIPGRGAALAQDFTTHLSMGLGLYLGHVVASALGA